MCTQIIIILHKTGHLWPRVHERKISPCFRTHALLYRHSLSLARWEKGKARIVFIVLWRKYLPRSHLRRTKENSTTVHYMIKKEKKSSSYYLSFSLSLVILFVTFAICSDLGRRTHTAPRPIFQFGKSIFVISSWIDWIL